ncbi:MAG: OmpA family protein [Spirochaetales bacterium]|nr:OmpA family protein [Spirochaetales bacterium]
MKKILLVLGAVVVSASMLFAQSQLPPGSTLLEDLKSPGNMANPAANIQGESSVNDASNPAASAYKQRITFDMNYTGIVGNDYGIGINPLLFPDALLLGYFANILNLGISLPSKAGVFTLSGEYFQGNSYHYDFGHMGGINFSYARDLTPEYSLGFGMNVSLGQNKADATTPFWAFTIDAGFIHRVKSVTLVSDFMYGVSLKNIGWGTLATEQRYMALFTPEVNLSFTAVEKNDFKLGFSSSLELPTFQNIKLGIGMSFAYSDVMRIDIGTRINVGELAGWYNFNDTPTYSSLFPSINFIYRYKEKDIKEEDSDKKDFNEFHLKGGFSPAGRNDLWAYSLGFMVPIGVYDSFAPVIIIDFDSIYNFTPENDENEASTDEAKTSTEKNQVSSSKKNRKFRAQLTATKSFQDKEKIRIYVAPNNNGINDNLIIPLKITDKRFIAGYNFVVEDVHGNIVRVIGNKEQREENKSISDYFKLKSGIEIPDKIIWDCTTEDGSVAKDGIYYFFIEAWDDNNNRARSTKIPFVIDATAPQITLDQPSGIEKIFNPNNVGKKSKLSISQDGSVEDLWVIEISNSFLGTVFRKELKNKKPSDFVWGGTDSKGILLPDGVYTYRIFAKDRAGNYSEDVVNNIIINTQETPVRMSVSDNFMSPNNDDIKESVEIFFDIPVTQGILTWKFDILNSDSALIYTVDGTEDFPKSIVFGNDLIGKVIPEGSYIAKLELLYMNGNNPKAQTPEIIVDITAPRARISQEYDVFSPDGDGNKDENIFFHETSKEGTWVAEIANKDDGSVVEAFSYITEPPVKFEWDGYLADGKMIPDGTYTYKLYSTDSAGNYGESNLLTFSIDTKETPVEIRTSRKAFSPNGDGKFDKLEIFPVLAVSSGIENCAINIIDSKGEVVREILNSSSVGKSYFWDGFDNRGDSVAEGEYSATLRVLYKNGNDEKAVSRKIVVDRIAPKLKITFDNLIFSPDGDGQKDSFNVKATSSKEDKWIAEILNTKMNAVKEYVWQGEISDFNWDGRDNKGNKVADGEYSLRIVSEDEAGNKTQEIVKGIEVDTRATAIFVTADKAVFSPNGDNIFDTVVIETLVNVTDGIEDWKLEVRDLNGRLYKNFKSDKGIPSKVVWDGKNDAGKVVEGKYKVYFEILYVKGNNPNTESDEILLDISAPAVSVKLAPVPFSPDNDGIDDTVDIMFSMKSSSGIKFWKFEIFDPKGNLFKVYEGFGDKVNKITWDGRSDSGETVFSAEDYKYVMTVFDNVANKAVVEGIIPVDILVVKVGDKLKIQIANINFAPNSAELETKDKEIADKNMRVLRRLAEILKKYDSYRITVEGHANSVKWYNETEREKEETEELVPLSLARAETVRKILISLGVKAERLNAMGIGGRQPLVDPKDDAETWKKENWKNRRVEFILEK